MRFLLLTATCANLYAQIPPANVQFTNPLGGNQDAIDAGRKTFVNSCSGCHGPNGEGGRGPNLVQGRQVKRGTDNQLFASIQKGLPGTDMPPTKLTDDQTWQVVAFIRALSMPASEMPIAGNAEAGRAIFFGKGNCNGCHMIHGQGGTLGPDLTNVGALRSMVILREAIYDPSARFAEGYQPATLTLRSGKRLDGNLRDRTNYNLQFTDKEGTLHLLIAADVAEVNLRQTGWMPDVKSKLEMSEMDNLLAFLARQSIRDPQTRERKPR